jgi:hypothetical protein
MARLSAWVNIGKVNLPKKTSGNQIVGDGRGRCVECFAKARNSRNG